MRSWPGEAAVTTSGFFAALVCFPSSKEVCLAGPVSMFHHVSFLAQLCNWSGHCSSLLTVGFVYPSQQNELDFCEPEIKGLGYGPRHP